MSEYGQIMRIFLLLVQCRRRQERHLMGRRQVLQDFFPAIQLKVCPTQNLLKNIRGVTLTVQNANTAGSFN